MDEHMDANRGSYAERAIQKRAFLKRGEGVAKRVYAPLSRPFTPIRGNTVASEHQEPTAKKNSKSAPMAPPFKAPAPDTKTQHYDQDDDGDDEEEEYGELQSVTTLVPPPRSLVPPPIPLTHMPAHANLHSEDFELEEFEALESQITQDIGLVGRGGIQPLPAFTLTRPSAAADARLATRNKGGYQLEESDEAEFTFHSSNPLDTLPPAPPLSPSDFLAEEDEDKEVEYGYTAALHTHWQAPASFPPSLFSSHPPHPLFHSSEPLRTDPNQDDNTWDDSTSFVDQRPPPPTQPLAPIGLVGSGLGLGGEAKGGEGGSEEDQGATQPFVRSLFLQRHRQQKQQQQGQHYATAIPPSHIAGSNPPQGTSKALLPSSSSSSSFAPAQPFHTTQSIKAQASLSLEVQQRVRQLDEELAKVAAEKSSLVKMRTELEKAASKLEQERMGWERRQAEEVSRMEEWKAGEVAKIQRERRVLEKQSRAILKLPNKKERSALDAAEAALEAERKESRAKDARHKLTVERLRRQIVELQDKVHEAREEVRWHEAQQLKPGLGPALPSSGGGGGAGGGAGGGMTHSHKSGAKERETLPSASGGRSHASTRIHSSPPTPPPVMSAHGHTNKASTSSSSSMIPQAPKPTLELIKESEQPRIHTITSRREDTLYAIDDDEEVEVEEGEEEEEGGSSQAWGSGVGGSVNPSVPHPLSSWAAILGLEEEEEEDKDQEEEGEGEGGGRGDSLTLTHKMLGSRATARSNIVHNPRLQPPPQPPTHFSPPPPPPPPPAHNLTAARALAHHFASESPKSHPPSSLQDPPPLPLPPTAPTHKDDATKSGRLLSSQRDVLVRETVNESDGKVERVYQSGRRCVEFPNGTRKVTLPDGHQTISFVNGDIKIQHPSLPSLGPSNGRIDYFYAEVGTWHCTYVEGVEVFYFPSGQKEAHHPGGLKEIVFHEGHMRKVFGNGAEVEVKAVEELSLAVRQPKPTVDDS